MPTLMPARVHYALARWRIVSRRCETRKEPPLRNPRTPDTILTPPRTQYGATHSKPQKRKPLRYAGFVLPRKPLQHIDADCGPEGLIKLYEEAPYDHLCFWGRLPGVTHEQALANMRLFSSEVAPKVREAVGAA